MQASSYNEADTRAKPIDPALHAASWLERVADADRESHGEIHREQSAIRIDILDGKPLERGRGRVDYLLRAYVGEHEHPLTLAFVEAKKEKLPPTQGLEQVKGYARRFAVTFVFSTNGHQFVEYDTQTGKTSDPLPMVRFPRPAELRNRWLAATGLAIDAPALTPMRTACHASGDRPRYYQDAAIRAVLERAALAAAGQASPRALMSLATGAGKTSIAVDLLQRLSDSGQLRRALLLVDRDELRTPAHTRLRNVFGADAKIVGETSDGINEAEAQRERALQLRERARALRKAVDDTAADRAAADGADAEPLAREATAKAQAIDDAVFDLKAVNPRETKVVDQRTPHQLPAAIETKGREVDEALARLRALVGLTSLTDTRRDDDPADHRRPIRRPM